MKSTNCKQEQEKIIESIKTLARVVRKTQNIKDLQNLLNSIAEIKECLNKLESIAHKNTG